MLPPIGYNPKDLVTYVAFIREAAANGQLFQVNPFTTLPQDGRYLLLLQDVLGLVCRLTGANPFTVLELSRVPLLALLLPVKLVMPLVLIVDFIATMSTGMRFYRDVAFDEITPAIPSTLLGLIAGVTLLVQLPAFWVLLALGVFILAYAVHSLVYHERVQRHSRWWSIPTLRRSALSFQEPGRKSVRASGSKITRVRSSSSRRPHPDTALH